MFEAIELKLFCKWAKSSTKLTTWYE